MVHTRPALPQHQPLESRAEKPEAAQQQLTSAMSTALSSTSPPKSPPMLPTAAPLTPPPHDHHSPVQQSTLSHSPCPPVSGSPLSRLPAQRRSTNSKQSRSVPSASHLWGHPHGTPPRPQPCSCPYLFVSSRIGFPEALHLAEGDIGAVTQPTQEGAGGLLCGGLRGIILLHAELSAVSCPFQMRGPRLQLIVQLHRIHRQVAFLCRGEELCSEL